MTCDRNCDDVVTQDIRAANVEDMCSSSMVEVAMAIGVLTVISLTTYIATVQL